MRVIEIPLVGVLSEERKEELRLLIPLVDASIHGVSFRQADGDVLCISHGPDPATNETLLGLERLVDEVWKATERSRPQVLFERAGKIACSEDPVPFLLDGGLLRETLPGAFSYSGSLLGLIQRLDELVRLHALAMGASQYSFSHGLPWDTAVRAGYTRHHPHLLCLQASPGRDPEVVRAFQSAQTMPDKNVHWKGLMRPAICLDYWASMGGQIELDGNLRVGTTEGTCFRSEEAAVRGLERLSEFRVRELFALGMPEDVAEMRTKFLGLLRTLLEELDLVGRIETATDSFYLDKYTHGRLYQLGARRKHELRVELPYASGRDVAVGSVNAHDYDMTDAFGIGPREEHRLQSCCMGIGLERMALAVLAQHGLDARNWPDVLQDGLDV